MLLTLDTPPKEHMCGIYLIDKQIQLGALHIDAGLFQFFHPFYLYLQQGKKAPE